MKKEFIRNEDGRIRDCAQNIAKMNIFEYIFLFRWNRKQAWINLCKEMWESIVEFAKTFAILFGNIFGLVFFPFVVVYYAIKTIKHNQEVCVFWEKELKPKKEKGE